MKRTLAIIFALALVPLLASLAGAQYATDFEGFRASTDGVTLDGQGGYFNPLPASSVDFLVYTYAGNDLKIPANPTGGRNFIACVGPGGSPVFLGRSERKVAWCGTQYTLGFDILANFVGTGTAADNLGSVSTQPSVTEEGFIALARWSTPGVDWKVSYQIHDAGGTASFADVPDPGFANLTLNHWYRWETDFDFSTHLITEVRLTDLASMRTLRYRPIDWYMRGGAAGSTRPTGFRFFAGTSVAGNLLAFDNAQITLNSPGTKAVAANYGSGRGRVNPQGSLPFKGVPLLDSVFPVGIHNPLATQTRGSATLLYLADVKADPGFMFPGGGMAGGAGEILIDARLFMFAIPGPLWDGVNPSMLMLGIPPDCALLGARLFLQGLIWDTDPRARVPLGLTEGLELVIGNV